MPPCCFLSMHCSLLKLLLLKQIPPSPKSIFEKALTTIHPQYLQA